MSPGTERQSDLTARLELSATILLIVVALLVGGFTVWDRLHPRATRSEPPPPRDPVSIEGAPIRGDRNAKVALIEFSDFECSYCALLAREVLPEIERQYLSTGKALLAWHHYPLPMHEHAQKAAEAAECAGRQGKFWDFHDWAFQHQNELDLVNLRAAAKALGLDLAAFGACLVGQATAKVKADADIGKGYLISGTPTWFIGVVQPDGKVKVIDRLTGAKRLADFQKVIDKAIATAGASSK